MTLNRRKFLPPKIYTFVYFMVRLADSDTSYKYYNIFHLIPYSNSANSFLICGDQDCQRLCTRY